MMSFHSRHLPTSIYSTIEDSVETLPDTSSIKNAERYPDTVPMPKIQYTVPGMKRGWKENGIWMDEDGPRNGPPQNFWRQMGDERLYNDNINLIQALLKLDIVETNSVGCSIFQTDSVNEMVERLERTNSIRIPTLNRLILGDWVPIVRGGKVVAERSTDEEKSANVPYRFHIQRSAGRKLAPKTHYGTFDEHLEPGEEVTIQELSSCNSVSSSGVLEVSPNKMETKLVEGYRNVKDGDLYFGGITYVTKYIMIMRREKQKGTSKDDDDDDDDGDGKVDKGPVTEIWMRIDTP